MTVLRHLAFAAFFLSAAGAGAQEAPFSFEAKRHSATSYAGNWQLRFGSVVPCRTGVTVGMVATDQGALQAVPVTITGAVGNLDEATPWVRRGGVVDFNPQTARTEARIATVQPVWIGTIADMELRQTLRAVVEGQTDAGAPSYSSLHSVRLGAPDGRQSLTAGMRLATGQTGAAADLQFERKLADHWTVTADFSHVEGESASGVRARYALSW